ncbi:MAG: hypothetical protein HYW49_01740 [Deltaproteobacteria bacterium]|nr:hypothetical protein [Deltaproteobacteria bacterium]
MKKIIIVTLLVSLSAFAQDSFTFKGHIQNSKFESLNGKECSLALTSIEAKGSQTIAYIAHPRIKNVSPIFNKRKAPLKTINVNDLQAAYDTYSAGRKNVLVGQGSKYHRELSQRLYVNFNNSGEVTSWDYRDGTETLYGYTFSCE